MDITLETLLVKRRVCEGKVDPNKICADCKYRDTQEGDMPCNDCFDSFAGIPFPHPTRFEQGREASHDDA